MANKRITLNQAQERGLAVMLAAHNARLASGIPPGRPLAADEYLELIAQPLLAQIAAQGEATTSDDIIRAVRDAVKSGNDAKISAVKQALGL